MDGRLMETNYKAYYNKQLSAGQAYQEWISTVSYDLFKIKIESYSTKEEQYNIGENALGMEIKNDQKFRETGNLYIEVKEKSHPENYNYVDSGIYRTDNSWLYCIGDYNTFYIFGKNHLQQLHKSKKYREVKTPTSIGFLLPLTDADNECEKKVIIEVTNNASL